jgi:hypothetical protein
MTSFLEILMPVHFIYTLFMSPVTICTTRFNSKVCEIYAQDAFTCTCSVRQNEHFDPCNSAAVYLRGGL